MRYSKGEGSEGWVVLVGPIKPELLYKHHATSRLPPTCANVQLSMNTYT